MQGEDRPGVRVEIDGGTAILTMDRAEKRNALSLAMMRELTRAFRDVGERKGTRAIVLRGEGPAFCAGHDLRELQCADAAAASEIFDACVELMETIQAVPQPVIAEVATIATAAGCQLVATCDLAVAAQEATFATPGVRIGLFCTTPMVALTRAIGRKRALEMLLTGMPVSARTAADWGLVNAVVPAGELREATRALAERIAGAAAATVARGKQAFYRQIDLEQGAAYRFAKAEMTANSQGEDAREGIGAFVEKRPARWQD